MSDLQNQKYRIEQMRQALNQFSKTATTHSAINT